MGKILVKIDNLSGDVKEVKIKDGASVAEIVEKAQINMEGLEIRFNGQLIDMDMQPENGDVLQLVKTSSIMDFITVRVGKLPGRIMDIALNGGRTVADALNGADLYSDGFEIRVNGAPADLEYNLANGDTVLLVKKITGN